MDEIVRFRYVACGGLEYQKKYSNYWLRVTGEMMLQMTAHQLREIAGVMNPGTELNYKVDRFTKELMDIIK